MKGCFVILNYKDAVITQKAVKYLKKLIHIDEQVIMIYDNGSGNGCMEKLRDLYRNETNIYVRGSEKNLGFSEGNNAAYQEALKIRSDYDFVVAMNSDVMIHQRDFIDRIENISLNGNCDIIGPDVVIKRLKTHHSPIHLNIPSDEELIKMIGQQKHRISHIDAYVEQSRSIMKKGKIISILPKPIILLYRKLKKETSRIHYAEVYEDVVISGCCIIYLHNYLKNENLLFEPDTFLYGEEILLSLKCKAKGYKIRYDPSLVIEHRESVSTKADFGTMKDHMLRESTHLIHALNIVRDCQKNSPWN